MIEENEWHRICVAWENIKGDWQLYKDAQIAENATGLMVNHVVPSGGAVVIGQDQGSMVR